MRKDWLLVAALAAALTGTPAAAAAAAGPELATVTVQATGGSDTVGYDGVVEAVRQTVIAAQVAGSIVALDVKAGDAVKAGQVLARIDAHAAQQSVAASDAQVQAARAALEVASREYDRQKQLYAKKYTSQGALERAEAQYKATQAQVEAQIAQAGAVRTQSGFFVVKAPYAGVVAEVPATLGDMAMPGRPLVTLYDPAALRVTAAIPQTAAPASLASAKAASATSPSANAAIRIELPGLAAERQWVDPTHIEVLPTADPATHTVQLRADLPAGLAGVRPGTFARAWLPGQHAEATRFLVPARAVVRRAELNGLYVLDPGGKPVLRQVRLGRASGDTVEVLSGVKAGERVALDPVAAARVR